MKDALQTVGHPESGEGRRGGFAFARPLIPASWMNDEGCLPPDGWARAGTSWACPILWAMTVMAALAALGPWAAGAETAAPVHHELVAWHEYGQAGESYWLFEPGGPRPAKAPVVIFLHGWTFTNPGVYGAWIDHLVRQGRIVIFPRYQASWATPPAMFLPNTETAVRDALRVLRTEPGHVRPDCERVALIGHSVGGDLAAHLASTAPLDDLPEPKAIVLLMPGRLDTEHKPDPASIPAGTVLAVAVADRDQTVGDQIAREIFSGAARIPPERRRYLLYRTGHQGRASVVADHLAPTGFLAEFDTGEGPFAEWQKAGARIDALDRLGFWRLADASLDAGFNGRTLDEASDRGALFRDLGNGTNGQTIPPPVIGRSLAGIPRLPRSLNSRLILGAPSASPGLKGLGNLLGSVRGTMARPEEPTDKGTGPQVGLAGQ
jgi:acetyl esterase/lipase